MICIDDVLYTTMLANLAFCILTENYTFWTLLKINKSKNVWRGSKISGGIRQKSV